MSKSNLKIALMAAGTLLLAGCSDILANPTDYSQALLGNVVTELDKNIASVVYDALRDGGNLDATVLDAVLLKIAEDKFGAYEANKTNVEKADFMADVQERIYSKLYSSISGGSYETRSLFSEARFAQYVKKLLYTVSSPVGGYVEDYVFLPATQSDILDGTVVNEAIHLSSYTEYIEGEIVPEIYRELLSEQYILDEDYSSIGRTYAREVNYVAIQTNNVYPEAAKFLMDSFINEYILDPTKNAADADLELLARAWRGIDIAVGSPEDLLLTEAGLHGAVDKTLYGQLLADFDKVDDNPLLTDQQKENDFTGNGTYTPEEGLSVKENSLRKQDFTTDGWFIKNGGLESLPSAIRDRLFNIGVANGVNKAIDEFSAEFTGADAQVSDYVRNLNGNYYLIPQNSQQNDPRNFLLYDATGTTYYIVQVSEAINTTKMSTSTTSTTNYDAITGVAGYRELIAKEVAKVLGTKDANKTSAMSHYLKLVNITFHDQDIYDYFKTKFPDIYDTTTSSSSTTN